MMKKYATIWIPLTCFFIFSILLLCNWILPIDLWIYHAISNWIHEPFTTIMKVFTFLGEPTTIFVLAIFWLIFLVRANKKEIKPFLSILLISLFFIIFLKLLFMRERPNILRLIPIDGYSFPSGHSIISVAFYGYFATYFMKNTNIKFLLILISLLLILGIGFSRIYLGVHYFSDVVAGYALGALSIGIGNLLRRKESEL